MLTLELPITGGLTLNSGALLLVVHSHRSSQIDVPEYRLAFEVGGISVCCSIRRIDISWNCRIARVDAWDDRWLDDKMGAKNLFGGAGWPILLLWLDTAMTEGAPSLSSLQGSEPRTYTACCPPFSQKTRKGQRQRNTCGNCSPQHTRVVPTEPIRVRSPPTERLRRP
jgi:hypothetical protein